MKGAHHPSSKSDATNGHKTPGADSDASVITPYLPRISLNWLADTPGASHRRLAGTMVFVDVSGFTALTEKLASRGKAGAEEITDVVGAVFGRLLDTAYSYGADLLKWGGDAVLLFFSDPGSAPRATRAAALMARDMNKVGRFRTSAGQIRLNVSMSAHSDSFDLYMLGDLHRELIVAGPAASLVAQLESAADKGEIVVSPATASLLPPGVLGAPKREGILLIEAPHAETVPRIDARVIGGLDVASLMPADTRIRLVADDEHGEHRQATVAFIQFSGVDALTQTEGGRAVADILGPIICRIEEASQRNGVNFHETDIGTDGGKVFLVGGVPVVRGNDAERVLRAVTEVVGEHPANCPVHIRAGVNTGRVFVFSHNFEMPGRRIFAVTGDAVNLAARVMGRASVGQVVATESVLARTRNPYETEQLAPFNVKGKTDPVNAAVVGRPRLAVSVDGGASLPFVGRTEELNEILERASAASNGSGGVIDVFGSAGIGKSRLISEVMDRWSLSTLRVVCDEYERATPYVPFRHILRQLIGITHDTPPSIAAIELQKVVHELTPEMEHFLPLIAELVDVPVPSTPQVDELDVRFRRRRLEQFVVQLLRAYIAEPSALVVEDAHAIDEASASLLGRIAEATTDLPLLIVLTRNEATEIPIPQGQGPNDSYLLLILEPLGAEASAQIAGVEASAVLSPTALSSIVERAGGNPMFLRELVRSAANAEDVDALPEAIEPLLVAQMDRLQPTDKRVLRAAAVLGTRFDLDLLRDLLDTGSDLDEGSLARLSTFVIPASRGWTFTHGLMRDAAYEALPFKRRHELHALAAAAIETRTANPDEAAELLSLHWMNAERFDRAWHYSKLAGERARSLWANSEATTFYSRALEASRHLNLPKIEVRSVAEALGDTCEVTANYDRSRSAYSVARRMSESDVDRARILRKTGILHERQGRYPAALALYTKGRRLLVGDTSEQRTERSELDLASAGIKDRQGNYRECIRFATAAEEEARRARHDSGLAHALYLRHMMSVYLSQPDDGFAGQALAIFEKIGDLVGQGNVLNNLGIDAYYRGKWDESLDLYERSRTARLRSGDVVGAATAENNIAEILSDQGSFEDAQILFESARATWRAAGYSVGTAFATSNLGRLAARSNEVARGRALLEEALGDFRKINSPIFVAETALRLVECRLLEGDFRSAITTAAELLEDVRGKPGFELIEVPALRLLGTASVLEDLADGRDSKASSVEPLDQAIQRSEELKSDYELAVGLAARSALVELRNQIAGLRVSSGVPGDNADRRRSAEIFSGLGVRQAT
ncbi:MAG: AAA family ATPase, partial [Acidimicrobiales bacterium]